tara:strand:- start:873 stop:2366 length:1494 start_codon:yes stop_codon:yes gene_type:complete
MDTTIKLNSYEGGDFTNSQNLVNFIIPSGAVYNLRDSYISINVKVNAVDVETTGGYGVYSSAIKWNLGTKNINIPNVALVKNCSIRCANKGTIEDIRRSDVLHSNLQQYTKSKRTKECESYLKVRNIRQPISDGQLGFFSEYNKQFITKSRALDIVPVSIPLNELFDFCNTDEYDTTKAGETRIRCELNINRLEPVQLMNAEADYSSNTMRLGLKMEDVDAIANNIYTNNIYSSIVDCPFWVGMKVQISANGTGAGIGSANDVPNTITSIRWIQDPTNANNGRVILAFLNNWATGTLTAGDNWDNIVILPSPWDSASTTLELNYAEIVLKEVKNPQNYASIDYSTFSTDQDNGNNNQNFRRQYNIEAEADNVLIMLPSDTTGISSTNSHLESYRLRMNNEDLTDRDVVEKSPLYYDRIGMTINNMGKRLNCLDENFGDCDEEYLVSYDDAENDVRLICNPLKTTDRTKLLQVDISCDNTGGINDIWLFKHLPREFVY